MNLTIDAGLAALIGALIGSLPPMIVFIIQRRSEHRKHLMDVALALSLKNYEENSSWAKYMNETHKVATTVPTLETYYHYHYKFQKMFDKKGNVSREDYIKIKKEQDEFLELIRSNQPKENDWVNRP